METTKTIKGRGHKIGGVRPAHEDFAVGEVDHPQRAVDHRVAQGNEGVDTSLGQAEYHEIEPVVGAVPAGSQGGGGPPDDQQQNARADQPHEDIGGRNSLSPVLAHENFPVGALLQR
jgi:hypothetical protein